MAYSVLKQDQVAAMNIDSYNRSVVASVDIENGNVFSLSGKSATAGQPEVWTAATPVTATLDELWMAYEPEVVLTVSGTLQYKGLNNDPRNFINLTGDVFTAFKPQVCDIITISTDGVAGTKASNGYAVAVDGTVEVTWAASGISGLTLKLLNTNYISIPSGNIGSQRVTAYQFEVTAIA